MSSWNESQQAYREVKSDVDRRFSTGRFVAVEAGRIIGDAENHRKLIDLLLSQGKDPRKTLIVQAGVEYPETAVIFFARIGFETDA